MAKAFHYALAAMVALGLLLVTACGSPPATGGNSTSAQATRWDFKYAGKLSSDVDAVNAVLALLHAEAKNDDAKLYLAEYLMVVDNRVAKPGDDQETWYVTLNMDRKPDSGQGEKQYWESAAWIVFKDGKVLPSSRHAGNATRILLDLRASSS